MADRFQITYQVQADSIERAKEIAESIRVEQTVEMPIETLPAQGVSSLGEIEEITPSDRPDLWILTISYPQSVTGDDLTQSLNTLFGNISLYPGIRILDADDSFFSRRFSGPSFGLSGLRTLLNRDKDLPLSCTALKPVGLTPDELADLALQFTRGGINIIKDDHGIANQRSAPFKERVAACSKAVREGEQYTGNKTLYFPNITTSPSEVKNRYFEAVELGADGVLVCPQLTGLEIISELAELKQVPVMAHPAFSGGYIIHETHGFLPEFYYGKLWRALGADAVIYPNAGGRFTLSLETCLAMNKQMVGDFCGFRSSAPTPAGGIHVDSIPGLLKRYGRDICYLIGGSLYQDSDGVEKATKKFTKLLEG